MQVNVWSLWELVEVQTSDGGMSAFYLHTVTLSLVSHLFPPAYDAVYKATDIRETIEGRILNVLDSWVRNDKDQQLPLGE